MAGDFTPEQKRYLEGLASGLQVARIARGNSPGRASRRRANTRVRTHRIWLRRTAFSRAGKSSPTRRRSNAKNIPSTRMAV